MFHKKDYAKPVVFNDNKQLKNTCTDIDLRRATGAPDN